MTDRKLGKPEYQYSYRQIEWDPFLAGKVHSTDQHL